MNTKLCSRSNKRGLNQGFTLTEVLIALTLSGMVLAAMTSLFLDSSRTMFIAEQKLAINHDIRNLTGQLNKEIREANHFLIYESYNAPMRTESEEAPYGSYRRSAGESGDFLVLITYDDLDPTQPEDWVIPPIKKITGFYRTPASDDASASGPLYMFTVNVPEAKAHSYPEELFPSVDDAGTHQMVTELSRGLAYGKLFYNYRARSIMVNAQIIHGNDAKRVTDTFNFTISPRG